MTVPLTTGNRIVSFDVNPTPVNIAAAITAAIKGTTLSVTTTDLGNGIVQIQEARMLLSWRLIVD